MTQEFHFSDRFGLIPAPPSELTSGVWYLASPYSSKSSDLVQDRYDQTLDFAYHLVMANVNLIEPIGTSHPMAQKFRMPTNYQFWKRRDRALINIATGVIVLGLPGYHKSIGVCDEVDYAQSLGRPIYFYEIYDNRFIKLPYLGGRLDKLPDKLQGDYRALYKTTG